MRGASSPTTRRLDPTEDQLLARYLASGATWTPVYQLLLVSLIRSRDRWVAKLALGRMQWEDSVDTSGLLWRPAPLRKPGGAPWCRLVDHLHTFQVVDLAECVPCRRSRPKLQRLMQK